MARVFYNHNLNRIECWINGDLPWGLDANTEAIHYYCKLKELQNQSYKIVFGM